MATAYTQVDSNVRRTWFLMFGFFIVVILLGWAFSWIFNSQLILIIAVVISILMNVISYWYSDKIILKMSGARPVKKEEFRELWNTVENLSIASGLPMPKLYIIQDPAPNAFATGRNPDHAVVAVTTGLLERLNKTELEGVIAHELSHIKNYDMLLMTITVVLVGFITLLSDFFLRMTIFGGIGGDRDGRAQLIMILIGIVLAILAPIVAVVIKMAISRKREYLADASGSLMTRYPEGLASALEKISASPQQLKKANHAMAHMYISNPFKGKGGKVSFMDKLFMTHPPVEERIKALRQNA
ncbi:MAG: zinc metalloprotease HtpX [Candidatus Paceibacterota bacterium]